jgi:hypothetical protein
VALRRHNAILSWVIFTNLCCQPAYPKSMAYQTPLSKRVNSVIFPRVAVYFAARIMFINLSLLNFLACEMLFEQGII